MYIHRLQSNVRNGDKRRRRQLLFEPKSIGGAIATVAPPGGAVKIEAERLFVRSQFAPPPHCRLATVDRSTADRTSGGYDSTNLPTMQPARDIHMRMMAQCLINVVRWTNECSAATNETAEQSRRSDQMPCKSCHWHAERLPEVYVTLRSRCRVCATTCIRSVPMPHACIRSLLARLAWLSGLFQVYSMSNLRELASDRAAVDRRWWTATWCITICGQKVRKPDEFCFFRLKTCFCHCVNHRCVTMMSGVLNVYVERCSVLIRDCTFLLRIIKLNKHYLQWNAL